MYNYSVFGNTDEQAAQFAAFFIRNREQFSKDMVLDEALIHLLYCVEHMSLILSYDEADELIAALNYWTVANAEDTAYAPDGSIVFISSALIAKQERSSRVFMHGFRDLINYIHEQNPEIHKVVFNARADNEYLNKLYSKFASFSNVVEGLHGPECQYSVDLLQLKTFLNRLKPQNKKSEKM